MEIQYNNPEFAEQRSNVKPLTLQENELVVSFLNILLMDDKAHNAPLNTELLQRFVWNYENMDHATTVNNLK